MNDDYLWDKSGEPDPDIQHLENVLGHYRYQAKPVPPIMYSRLGRPRLAWYAIAAAAAIVLVALAGFWMFKLQQRASNDDRAQIAGTPSTDQQSEQEPAKTEPPNQNPNEHLAKDSTPEFRPEQPKQLRRVRANKVNTDIATSIDVPGIESSFVSERQPIVIPFIDMETARHLERVQLMLRSFRNSAEADSQNGEELSYEKQQSRDLLSKNIVLRRDAEARGNLPAGDLLNSIEPFLLDIANLSDRPTNDDVRSIKRRMQEKEIVSVLQIYSAPLLSQTF